MPVTVMGYTDVAMLYKQPQKLCDTLGFTNRQEMRAFLDGPRFSPLFKQYADLCIYPQQKKARTLGTIRGRGHSMETVEKRIIAAERPGSTRFSEAVPDKTGWDSIDHLAYMIFHLKKDNIRNVNGLFYGKALNDTEILDILWSLCKHEEWNHSPARRKDQQNKRKKELQQEPAKRQKELQQGSSPEGSDEPIAGNQPAQPAAEPLQQPTQSAADPSHQSAHPIAGTLQSGQPIIEHLDMTAGDTEEGFMDIDTFSETVSSFGTEVTFTDSAQDNKRLRTLDEELKDEELEDNMDSLTLGSAITLSNAQRMAEENTSPTMDLRYRFWQCVLIDTLIQAKGDVEFMQQAMDYLSNLDHLANAESEDWMKMMIHRISEDSIIFQPHTEESAKAFDIQQEYFDNVDYQREDLVDACAILDIEWKDEGTIFRMPGMALSQTLRYWQPVAIKAIIDFYLDPHIRGCILGDVMGLGKTWVVICYLLWMVQWRRRQPVDDRAKAKPTLILVPIHLMNQWIRSFDLIAPGQFTLYKYHGDSRISRYVPIACEHGLDILSKKHALFSGKEQNAHAVILSTIHTWNERHGPKAQAKYHKNKTMETDRMELDPKWEGGLSGCFRIAVVDEAQLLKSVSAGCSQAVLWLDIKFHIFVTGTPTPNGIKDWAGYMPFIQSLKADKWWEPKSLKEMGFKEDENPFAVPDDHPAAKLRLTVRGVKDWVLRYSINAVEQGHRLSMIWKKVLIRRTHSSRIPFDAAKTIGEDLPRVQGALITCSHTEDEARIYKELEDNLLGNLITGTKKPKWSLGVHRKLAMLTMWTYLPNLDAKFDFKATNVKKTLEKDEYYVEWFKEHFDHIDLNKPGRYLQELLLGAPKIRALLRNIRSQVLRDREKVLIWCQLPAATVLLCAIFKMLRIDLMILSAHQKADERDRIMERFNGEDDSAMILIMTYAVGSTGLNLQHRCWRVHILESAHNLGTLGQAVARARRLGNPSPVVYVYEYFVNNSFDDRAMWRAIEKAVPEAMAELNRLIFSGEDESLGELDVGDWVIEGEELVRLENATFADGEVPHILSAHELLRHILMAAKGEKTVV